MVTSGPQNGLPLQVVVADASTCPDIAVLLAATSENTDLVVVKNVNSPDVDLNTKVQVMFTALPEIEPLMELVMMVMPAVGGMRTVPEIDEPV
jgi:hypothetical protein